MLDVRRLRVLRELAARGTIAATADALGYTAPAVSQQLAALEREAGVALLEKNGRGRRLTPAGEDLVPRTEGILRQLEAAEAALERTTTHVAGVLALRGVRERPPDPAPARDRRPRDGPSRPARDHEGHGARGQPARAQARRARPGARAGVRVRTDARRPGARAHRPDRRRAARRAARRPPAGSQRRGRHQGARSRAVDRRPRGLVLPPRRDPLGPRRPATSRASPTSPTTSRSRTRSWRQAPASGSCPSWPARRRPASSSGRWPASPPSRRIYAAVRAGSSARPAIAAMLGRAHRALRTESSSPGKRPSSSSRRSRFTTAVPVGALLDHAVLAQHAEVVRARRLRHRQPERAALALAAAAGGQRADDLQPHRVGERVQHAGQLERLGGWMMEGAGHGRNPLYDGYRTYGTMIIELRKTGELAWPQLPPLRPRTPNPTRPPFKRIVVFTGLPTG